MAHLLGRTLGRAARAPRPLASPLVGAWRLVRVQLRSASGRCTPALFSAVVGSLTYRADGRVALALGDCPDGDTCLGFDGTYLSYIDPFSPIADRVVHRVETGRAVDWAGSEQSQRIRLRGDELVWLGETARASGETWTAELVWERIAT